MLSTKEKQIQSTAIQSVALALVVEQYLISWNFWEINRVPVDPTCCELTTTNGLRVVHPTFRECRVESQVEFSSMPFALDAPLIRCRSVRAGCAVVIQSCLVRYQVIFLHILQNKFPAAASLASSRVGRCVHVHPPRTGFFIFNTIFNRNYVLILRISRFTKLGYNCPLVDEI